MLLKFTEEGIDFSKVDRPSNFRDMTSEQLKSAVLAKAYWTVNGDESGLYLRDPNGEVITTGGKPITVRWEDLSRLWQPPEP
jgi:hypothetical protein